MLIPAEKNRTYCYYCQDIIKVEENYPIRKGEYSFEGLVNRCLWHSRFQCSLCNKYFHFSFLFWCPSSDKVICGKCQEPTFYPVKFWDKKYAYAFDCPECGKIHFDLLYSEFMGTHPWQINKGMLYNKGSPLVPITKKRYPWEPIWKPREQRTGTKISIEEALKQKSLIPKIIEDRGGLYFHSEVISDQEVHLEETLKKWEKTSQSWIENFSDLEDKGDASREFIIDPALWQQLGDINGLKVLDAGCGNGYLSRLLAKKGASVVGVDFSKHFIGHCKKKEKEESLGCEFFKGSLTDMSFLEDEMFDLVVSNVVLVDVQDYKQAFIEINRVLKPNGRFVWSNLHPVFGSFNQVFYRLPYDTARNEERLFVIMDNYFNSGAMLMSWGKMKPIWQFDRTLEEYTKALFQAGFLIREIIEPRPSVEDLKKHPKMLAFDANRIPIFIIFDCVKAKQIHK